MDEKIMTEHTQWKVVENRNNHWGMVEVEGPSLSVVGFTIATDVTFEEGVQKKRDAALIAAAPDLLSELEATADAYCDACCPTTWPTGTEQPHTAQCVSNRAVINKARGK